MAGVGVSCRQTAKPAVAGSLLMVVFSGSDVDHAPAMSGIMGQLPLTSEDAENWASFPGESALWSAVAFGGLMAVVIEHESLAAPLQRIITADKSAKASKRDTVFARAGMKSSKRIASWVVGKL